MNDLNKRSNEDRKIEKYCKITEESSNIHRGSFKRIYLSNKKQKEFSHHHNINNPTYFSKYRNHK